MIINNSTGPSTQGTGRRRQSLGSSLARLRARASQSHVAGFLAGLLLTAGLLATVDFRVAANNTEISAFTGKSTAYNTYYNSGSRTCSTCHASGFAVGGLSSYGSAMWNRLITLGFSGTRTLAQDTTAITDIESSDADNDGYSNLVEINANTDASSSGATPTLSAGVTSSHPIGVDTHAPSFARSEYGSTRLLPVKF